LRTNELNRFENLLLRAISPGRTSLAEASFALPRSTTLPIQSHSLKPTVIQRMN
jgi:hypothetical protein